MLLLMPEAQLLDLTVRQLTSFYPIDDDETAVLEGILPFALARCEACFSHVRNKYYSDGEGNTRFSPFHGCQHSFFLYTLSRLLFERGGACLLCDKLYGILRFTANADLFYQVALPEVVTFDHPLGAVMGRASYSNYFTFSQGCTVGNNHGIFPRFGESVFMLSNSKILGNCEIGSDVIISANAYVKDADIPSGSIVFGQSPNLVILHRPDYVREHAERVFRYD